MADSASAVDGFLHGKTAGLPNSIWIVVVGGGIGYAVWKRKKSATSTDVNGTPTDGSGYQLQGQAAAQFLPVSPPTDQGTTSQSYSSNTDWQVAALKWVTANPTLAKTNVVSAGITITSYLNGGSLDTTGSDLIQAIVSSIGPPPFPPSGTAPSGQVYLSNADWARAALSWYNGQPTSRFPGAKAENFINAYLKGGPIWADEYGEIDKIIKGPIGAPPDWPGVPIIWPITNPQSGSPAVTQPAPPSVPAPTAPTHETYTVKPGDNLTSIGRKFGKSWQTLYNANRNIIKNPNLIYPGQVLTIP